MINGSRLRRPFTKADLCFIGKFAPPPEDDGVNDPGHDFLELYDAFQILPRKDRKAVVAFVKALREYHETRLADNVD
jgi:hypothetical protein